MVSAAKTPHSDTRETKVKDTMRPPTKIVIQLEPDLLATYTTWAGSQHAAIASIKRVAVSGIKRQARILDGTRKADLEQQRIAKQIDEEKS